MSTKEEQAFMMYTKTLTLARKVFNQSTAQAWELLDESIAQALEVYLIPPEEGTPKKERLEHR